MLGLFAWSQNRDAWYASADHGDLVAAMQAWAVLAILEDLVGQFRLVFDGTETIFEKEVGDARKEADGLNAVLFSFLDERRKNASACALALGAGLDHDGAHFAEVWSVKVQCAPESELTRSLTLVASVIRALRTSMSGLLSAGVRAKVRNTF